MAIVLWTSTNRWHWVRPGSYYVGSRAFVLVLVLSALALRYTLRAPAGLVDSAACLGNPRNCDIQAVLDVAEFDDCVPTGSWMGQTILLAVVAGIFAPIGTVLVLVETCETLAHRDNAQAVRSNRWAPCPSLGTPAADFPRRGGPYPRQGDRAPPAVIHVAPAPATVVVIVGDEPPHSPANPDATALRTPAYSPPTDADAVAPPYSEQPPAYNEVFTGNI